MHGEVPEILCLAGGLLDLAAARGATGHGSKTEWVHAEDSTRASMEPETGKDES